MQLRPIHAVLLLSSSLAWTACDNSAAKDELKMEKTKSVYDLKQAPKEEMSEEELKAAREKAGFKSPEDQRAEAREAYDKMERGYIKGRLAEYRKLLKAIGKKLDEVEKAAPKWAGAKGEAAFNKFSGKFKEQNKATSKSYDDLTEKGSRGGDTQVSLDKLVTTWEDFNNDLAPEIASAEAFQSTVAEMRAQIEELEKVLTEIESDESIEAETPDEDDEKK